MIIINMNSVEASVKKILDEIRVKEKTPYGWGTEHKIFPSQKHPDRLYKVGNKESVENWFEIFKSNKNMFPKVYGAGYFKNNPDVKFVEIEKLDTKKVDEEWTTLEFALQEIGMLDEDLEYLDDILYATATGNYNTDNILKKLKLTSPKNFTLFKKWTDFISEVTRFLKSKGYEYFDVHRHNFGYDNSGNIKALDI